MTANFLKYGTLLGSVLFLSGCGEDLVGKWEGQGGTLQDQNEMEIEDDGKGDATIYFSSGGSNYKTDFDIDWEEGGGDDEYDIEMDCRADSTLDFKMECDINDDGDELECKGDGGWSDYEFEWKKDE